MAQKILLPLDGSTLAERAVPYGLRLASEMGAHLLLMHGRPPRGATTVPDFDVAEFARGLREGEAVGALSDSRRIDIEAITREVYLDKAAEAICQTAVEEDVDLIVMSTHGHGGLGRKLFGTTADQVLCRATVPVVLVSSACTTTWTSTGPRRILLPLDGSHFAEAVLEPAGRLAGLLQAELFLVGAAGPMEAVYDAATPSGQERFDAALRETQDYLESVASSLRELGHIVHVDAESGRPATVLSGVASRRHIDMIALATHGRTGIARLTLGSVASEALQQTTVPLFLVRPDALREIESQQLAATQPR
ncbi:MAG: universal stress protein [Chloroflexota bacterium]